MRKKNSKTQLTVFQRSEYKRDVLTPWERVKDSRKTTKQHFSVAIFGSLAEDRTPILTL